jgi:hypothetical protein
LNPCAFNSWLAYSNISSIFLWSFAMSSGFCSLTFTTAQFSKHGASPCIALSHAFFPSQAPCILLFFVTSTLYSRNPFFWHFSASFSWVLLKPPLLQNVGVVHQSSFTTRVNSLLFHWSPFITTNEFIQHLVKSLGIQGHLLL